MKNKNLKRYLDLGVAWGTIGAYFIYIYFQVSRLEGFNENSSINKFYFDNAEIIKSTILLSALVFILMGVILIFYYLRRKSRAVKFSIQSDHEITNVNFGEKPPIDTD